MPGSAEHQKANEGTVGFDGRLVAKKISRDGSEAIRVADDANQSVAADRAVNGEASYEINGSSRQNEAGVLVVCKILADRLRTAGLSAGEPRRPSGEERGIDCEIPCGDRMVAVQVTRPATPGVWRTLALSGRAGRHLDTYAAVRDLHDVVIRKAARTPPADRQQLLLAVDVTETVVHAMDGVVQAFRQRHAPDVQALGFAAVWVVGPEAGSVHRLDVEEERGTTSA